MAYSFFSCSREFPFFGVCAMSRVTTESVMCLFDHYAIVRDLERPAYHLAERDHLWRTVCQHRCPLSLEKGQWPYGICWGYVSSTRPLYCILWRCHTISNHQTKPHYKTRRTSKWCFCAPVGGRFPHSCANSFAKKQDHPKDKSTESGRGINEQWESDGQPDLSKLPPSPVLELESDCLLDLIAGCFQMITKDCPLFTKFLPTFFVRPHFCDVCDLYSALKYLLFTTLKNWRFYLTLQF